MTLSVAAGYATVLIFPNIITFHYLHGKMVWLRKIKYILPINRCTVIWQGCHWSGKSQGNSRSGKSQNFVLGQGILRKVREIQENPLKVREI